jgi:hypothetical protein
MRPQKKTKNGTATADRRKEEEGKEQPGQRRHRANARKKFGAFARLAVNTNRDGCVPLAPPPPPDPAPPASIAPAREPGCPSFKRTFNDRTPGPTALDTGILLAAGAHLNPDLHVRGAASRQIRGRQRSRSGGGGSALSSGRSRAHGAPPSSSISGMKCAIGGRPAALQVPLIIHTAAGQ